MGVSGWMFPLVPAYPGCPGSKAVKRSLLCNKLSKTCCISSQQANSIIPYASADAKMHPAFCWPLYAYVYLLTYFLMTGARCRGTVGTVVNPPSPHHSARRKVRPIFTQARSVVSVCREPCKNGRTNRDAVWNVDALGLNEPRIRWGPDPRLPHDCSTLRVAILQHDFFCCR